MTRKTEEWRIIDDYPNYAVSNNGRVKNVVSGIVLKTPVERKSGYCKVNLYHDGVGTTYGVHQLVAKMFIPNPEKKRVVHHINCDKTDNSVTNLEWATDSENMLHAFADGLCENTRNAARIQQQELAKKPRTERQLQSARENICKINARPKTEKQLEACRKNINNPWLRQRSVESKYESHPLIRVIETGYVYASQLEVANELKTTASNVCRHLRGETLSVNGYHLEYVTGTSFLYDYQYEAVNYLRSGSILCGSVGSGKSRTALFWYFKECGGWIDKGIYTAMRDPKDLYIITTAKKRDSLEWSKELANFIIYPNKDHSTSFGINVYVDSWNNITKYADVTNSYFILDEQRLVSYGTWTKTFLKIAKKNKWILLSATPGDSYYEYLPVFLANGFYKNKSEFDREHVVYSRYTKYPKIDRYVNTTRLDRLRNRILVKMNYHHDIKKQTEDIYCEYDRVKYRNVLRNRWNPYKEEPIRDAGGLCQVLRQIVNTDVSRQVALLEILETYKRVIIFYNYNYERDILLNLGYMDGTEVAEWTGHAHQPIPESDQWVYICQYNSASEGWECIKTDCIIFYSQNYSYKMMTQAAGRIDRLNTPYDVLHYYHLKSRSPIDLAISRALSQKKSFNERKFIDKK